MASNKVNLGIGAVGMLYKAPVGTTLPSYPSASLSSWKEVGAIDENGITWTPNKDSEPIRNWAKIIERLKASTEGGIIKFNLLYTNQDTFEFLFGEDNVEVTAATAEHGNLVSVDVEAGVSAPACALVFLMKDGDDMIMLASENATVTTLDDISFVPTDPILYGTSVESAKWRYLKDDGQVTS